MKKRCEWAKDEPNITYHDKEWGRPQHNDQKLFEFLILEGAQVVRRVAGKPKVVRKG